MTKKKILKKQKFSFQDIPKYNVPNKKSLTVFNPEEFFKDDKEVGHILLQCLRENDTEAFMEILDSYLSVNRTHLAEASKLSRSTISLALASKGNPTLKTLAKIIHETTALRKWVKKLVGILKNIPTKQILMKIITCFVSEVSVL